MSAVSIETSQSSFIPKNVFFTNKDDTLALLVAILSSFSDAPEDASTPPSELLDSIASITEDASAQSFWIDFAEQVFSPDDLDSGITAFDRFISEEGFDEDDEDFSSLFTKDRRPRSRSVSQSIFPLTDNYHSEDEADGSSPLHLDDALDEPSYEEFTEEENIIPSSTITSSPIDRLRNSMSAVTSNVPGGNVSSRNAGVTRSLSSPRLSRQQAVTPSTPRLAPSSASSRSRSRSVSVSLTALSPAQRIMDSYTTPEVPENLSEEVVNIIKLGLDFASKPRPDLLAFAAKFTDPLPSECKLDIFKNVFIDLKKIAGYNPSVTLQQTSSLLDIVVDIPAPIRAITDPIVWLHCFRIYKNFALRIYPLRKDEFEFYEAFFEKAFRETPHLTARYINADTSFRKSLFILGGSYTLLDIPTSSALLIELTSTGPGTGSSRSTNNSSTSSASVAGYVPSYDKANANCNMFNNGFDHNANCTRPHKCSSCGSSSHGAFQCTNNKGKRKRGSDGVIQSSNA